MAAEPKTEADLLARAFRDAVGWGGPWGGFVQDAAELLALRRRGATLDVMTNLLYQRFEVRGGWKEGDFSDWRDIVASILIRLDHELSTPSAS